MLNENYIQLIEISYRITNRHTVPISFFDRVKLICNEIKIDERPIIFDITGEGDFGINLFLAVIDYLKLSPSKFKIIVGVEPNNKLNNFEFEVNHTGLCNYCNYYTLLQEKNIDWQSIKLNNYFVCLSRRASTERAFLVKGLLDFFPNKTLLSFGFQGGITTEIQRILHPHVAPITIDHQVQNKALNKDIHIPPDYQIFQSMFNIVLETNSPNNPEIFVTEKTFKSFAWHQLPIFYANKKHIEVIRSLGFDLFDDILDHHSYANTSANNQHMSIMILLKKLIHKYPSMDDLQSLRELLIQRLKYNNNLLQKYVESDRHEWKI